ncbi:MAG TPA: ORF6N domain-containing protein, partial [bacterium]
MGNDLIPLERIRQTILLIRGQKVMLDRDLAILYGIETRVLKQAVKRNRERFPDDFMFELTRKELRNISQGMMSSSENDEGADSQSLEEQRNAILTSQSVISSWGGRRALPYAFTEQGVAMLSSVLNSPRAIKVNIAIMRAFVQLRQFSSSHADLTRKLDD